MARAGYATPRALARDATLVGALDAARCVLVQVGKSADYPAFMRCIFGNPFRPVTLDPNWRTSTVVSLAEGVYADREWDRLPVLADALDDAGCDRPDVIGHLRGPGPHARSCWVVDLLLGKT